MFSLLIPAYADRYGVSQEQLKEVLTHIAWKNHHNGALNPRAQFRREVSREAIACAPTIAGPLSVMDCSGVSDGAAAAVIVRAEDAHRYTDKPLYVKALSLVAGPGTGAMDPAYDYTTFHEVIRSAEEAYRQAGVTDPAAEIAMAEVHDCFTPTELVLMEDLGFAERGTAWKEVLAGTFDLDGEPAGQPGRRAEGLRPPDRRVRSADAVRVLAAAARRGRRPADRLARPRPVAGADPQPRWQPGDCVSFVSIVGSELS